MSAAAILVSLLSITSALALPTQPSGGAIPIQKRASSTKVAGVADIQGLKAQIARFNDKYEQGFAAFEANTGAAHPLASGFKARHSKRAGGAAGNPLTDAQEELWYGTISVGTPAKQFTIDFDTGSSDLFVPSSSCSSCGQHTSYNPESSSTAKDLRKSFKLQYGDGSTTSGEQYSDTVTIAGLTATGVAVGSATQYSSSFESGPTDGLLGLAFPSLSAFPATPYFNKLVQEGGAAAGVFGFYLAESGSELYLGGTNTAKYKGSFNWNSVTQEGYWQVNSDGITVGGRSAVGQVTGIIDSGTTLIVGPTSDVSNFYASIPGSQDASSLGPGLYSFPCNSLPSDIEVSFGGVSYKLDPQYFNLGSVSQGSDQCVGGVAAQDQLPFWIFGDVFMRNVYTAFDFDNSRVGFASLA